jgi:hypothetical protein
MVAIAKTAIVAGLASVLLIAADQPRMTASGRVVDESGNGVAGMTVEGSCYPSDETLQSPIPATPSKTTSSDGRFVVSNLSAGECRLRVYAPWGTCSSNNPKHPCFNATKVLVVKRGEDIRGLLLTAPPEPPPTGDISGRILDASGAPVAGLAVEATCGNPADPQTREQTNSNTTLADGVFTVTYVPPGLCRLRPLACDDKTCSRLSKSDSWGPSTSDETCLEVPVEALKETKDVTLTVAPRH